ncbi:hypothetical protein [Escherichia coli]|uniref:hypothetical protein n=1 Tax=Escherichia coli TaxID=562 RepID=UPI003B27E7C8
MRLIQTVTASDTLSRHLQNDRNGPQDLRPETPDEEQSNALAEHENPADTRRHAE